jgi:predicted nucleic acid-binding Zn ribbon protein
MVKSKPPHMERASKFIRDLPQSGETITAEELARSAWSHAVGKRIAAHTAALRMVRARLIVAVEDITWQKQLFALSGQILRNLEKHLGPGVVEDLEFRIIPRRREPDRAAQSMPALVDEAASIADPVLRSIYRASRQKAQA